MIQHVVLQECGLILFFVLDAKMVDIGGYMNKKKLLFIITSLEGGGAEKVLVDILNNFNYAKFDVTLLLLHNRGVYLDFVPKCVEVLFLDSYKYNFKSRFIVNRYTIDLVNKIRMRSLFKGRSFDYIISFLEGEPLYFHQYIIHKGRKNISWVHADLLTNHWSKWIFKSDNDELSAYQKMNKIICVSKKSEDQFKLLYNVDIQGTQVIYNLIDKDEIIRKANDNTISVPAKRRFTIVNVGRLNEQKRQDRLLEVVANLKSKGILVDVWIIGDGKLRQKLEIQAENLGILDQVIFMGFQRNPYPFIKQADIFVLTSDSEGYPLVVAEALCLEKGIVSTAVCGPEEMLKDGFGILTSCDIDDLSNAIEKLYHSNELQKHYEKMAEKRSMIFSPKETIEQIETALLD